MYTLVLLILLGVAGHSISRLITRDLVPFGALRETFVQRWGTYDEPDGTTPNPTVSINGKKTNKVMRTAAYGIECDWCVSVWVTGTLVLVTDSVVTVPLPWLMWPAARSIAALIARFERD